MLSFAKGRGGAHVTGAIDPVCRVNQRSNVSQRDAPLVQVVVNVVGDHLWLPTPTEVVADVVRLRDECLFRLWWPIETDGAQCVEVCVILRGGCSRNRSATNQGSAGHHGDGESD